MGSKRVIIRRIGGHLALLTFLGLPVALAAGQGCGRAVQLCDQFCECEHCNDRQEDECLIVVDATLDAASEYECTDEADAYYDCAIDRNDCDDTNFSVDDGCDDERDDLLDCIADNSDIYGPNDSVGQGPSPQQGQVGNGGGATFCACACTCTMCTINDAQRTCQAGEGGCESCDVVCGDACLGDATCGGLDSSVGECIQGQ